MALIHLAHALEVGFLLVLVAARLPETSIDISIKCLLQLCTHCGLLVYISFIIFWVTDVFDSVRLNRGGTALIEACGTYGCRVGFNGERIHFGAGGCRCVGGGKNRGIIDYSPEMACQNTLIFVQETDYSRVQFLI